MREPLDLSSLPGMSLAQLREAWARHMGRARAPVQKRLLVRELAWRTQERTHGGMDRQTHRLLREAMRKAVATRTDRKDPQESDPRPRQRSRSQPPTLPASSRLVRTWRGTAHEVHVLEGGRSFRYQGRTYASLSEIAREITGTRWSGPRFFGLVSREQEPEQTAAPRRAKGGSAA